MTACTGYIAYSGSDRVDRPCPVEAAENVTAGCAHEHIGQRLLCVMHAGEARAGVLLCGDCLSSPREPHRCRLRVLTAAPVAA
jgi:hypothetical protein